MDERISSLTRFRSDLYLEVGSKVVKKWSRGGQSRVKDDQWNHFDSDGFMEFES